MDLTRPQIGVVEAADLAAALDLLGFGVTGGEGFRQSAVDIRNHPESASLPIIVQNVARPGIRAWVDKQASMGSRVVVLNGANARAIPSSNALTALSLPTTVNQVLAAAGWGPSAHALGSSTVEADATIPDLVAYASPATPPAPEPTQTVALRPAPVLQPAPVVDVPAIAAVPETAVAPDLALPSGTPAWANDVFGIPATTPAVAEESAAEPAVPDVPAAVYEPVFPAPLTAAEPPVAAIPAEPIYAPAPVFEEPSVETPFPAAPVFERADGPTTEQFARLTEPSTAAPLPSSPDESPFPAPTFETSAPAPVFPPAPVYEPVEEVVVPAAPLFEAPAAPIPAPAVEPARFEAPSFPPSLHDVEAPAPAEVTPPLFFAGPIATSGTLDFYRTIEGAPVATVPVEPTPAPAPAPVPVPVPVPVPNEPALPSPAAVSPVFSAPPPTGRPLSFEELMREQTTAAERRFSPSSPQEAPVQTPEPVFPAPAAPEQQFPAPPVFDAPSFALQPAPAPVFESLPVPPLAPAPVAAPASFPAPAPVPALDAVAVPPLVAPAQSAPSVYQPASPIADVVMPSPLPVAPAPSTLPNQGGGIYQPAGPSFPGQDFSAALAPTIGVAPAGAVASATVIICFAGKGGVGKTSSTIVLAEAAAKAGLRVAVIDMNRGQGDIRSYLRLADPNLPSILMAATTRNVASVVLSPERLNDARSEHLPKLAFGVVLAPPQDLADPTIVTTAIYGEAIEYLRSRVDLIVIDTQIAEGFDTTGLIDHLVVPELTRGGWGLGITDMSKPGLENLLERVKDFAARGVPRDRLMLMVNKANGFSDTDAASVQKRFDSYGVFVGAAGDDASFQNAMNLGQVDDGNAAIGPVARAALFRVFQRPEFMQQPTARKRSLFGRRR